MEKLILISLLFSQYVYFSHCFVPSVNLIPDPTSYKINIGHIFDMNGRSNSVEDVHLRFYNGKTFDQYMDVNLKYSTQILKDKEFNINEKTVFYVHGWGENGDKESVETVVSTYLKYLPNVNVILVDWSNMAAGPYMVEAAPNTKVVGEAVAIEIKKMIEHGLPLDNIHIVGHSLGGQVSGFIGSSIQTYGIKLRRISALDPAFPMFYPGLVLGHISANDADFVDVIHTAAKEYGAPVSTGTADFWPNGGKPVQPGCKRISKPLSPDSMCSHWRSWRFWAESISSPKAFPARIDTNRNNNVPDVVYMGEYTDNRAQGDYYLETNKESPFGNVN